MLKSHPAEAALGLATMVKLSRTTMVRVLQRFERRGLVRQAYRTLYITDVRGLAAVESEAWAGALNGPDRVCAAASRSGPEPG